MFIVRLVNTIHFVEPNYSSIPAKANKCESPHLGWAMYHASRLTAIYSPTLKAYYEKRLAEGKHYNVVLSHVTKKLIRVIFHLLQTGESYKEVRA
ncbi:hypothetical protein [Clostridium sp. 1xD42-85]|uniref:hypothetical protein n=1 Tax=Clostridium sp. 1xD42-85 TaxID=2320084 RepID=UPI0016020C59|nr:hypothetical protein [Clostridium sp. 1xD42-85]